MKRILPMLWLGLAGPMAYAAVGCGDLKYGSEAYASKMRELAAQANLPRGAYTKYHERVVNNICQDDADDTRKLVELGYVPARDVAALQRVLRREPAPVAAAPKPQAAPKPAADKPIDPAALPAIARAIDAGFAQWSAQWMWDRYVPGSIAIGEGSTRNGVHLVRGTFRFVRGGGMASIPFASALQQQDTRWIVTSLCYNDTTSGMTDCANSGISAGARQFMGAVILGGLLAAISGYGGADAIDRGRPADYDPRRETEEREERERAHRREQERLDRDWSRMFEPSPLLPPPATIN